MKLYQLLKEEEEEKPDFSNSDSLLPNDINTIYRYVHNGVANYNLDQSIERAMEAIPQAVYKGPMIRALNVPYEWVYATKDYRLLLSKLQEYDRQDRYFAWSKNVAGMESVLRAESDTYESPTYFVIAQDNGIGLDINTMFAAGRNQYRARFNEEHEVLAKITNTVHLIGFVMGTIFYPPDNYADFLKEIKSYMDEIKQEQELEAKWAATANSRWP